MTRASTGISNPEQLAQTLIDVTKAITQGSETIEVFTALTERCVTLIPVSAAGILLRDLSGSLQVVGASSRAAHLLDLFQLQNQEGPCLECCETGMPVLDDVLSATGKWPRFAELARSHGFAAVYALPLRSRGVTVGALNLFAEEVLDTRRVDVGQALADAATLSLMQVDPTLDYQLVVRSIHVVIESRNTVDQATGMIAQRYSIGVEEALLRLREAADQTGLTLVQTATAIIERGPTFTAL